MAFTFIAISTGTADGAGATLDCSTSLNVQAGDLLVAWIKYEGGLQTGIGVQKNSGSPTNAFTFEGGDAIEYASSLNCSFGYLLSAAADATATFRLTLSDGSMSFRRMMVLQYRPTASFTVSKDGSNRAANFGDAPNSGDITTVGTDNVVVGAYGEFSANTTSAEQVGGVGATEPTGSPVAGSTSVWYRFLSSTMTGAASATLALADWVCAVIAFKQVSSGPTTSFPPYAMNPMSKLIVR